MKYVLALACFIGSLVPGAASAAMFEVTACAGTVEIGCVDFESQTGSGIASLSRSANYSDDFGARSSAFAELEANEGELLFKAHAEASAGSTFAEPQAAGSVHIYDKITPRGLLDGFVSFQYVLTGGISGSGNVIASLELSDDSDLSHVYFQEIRGPGTLNLGNTQFRGFWNFTLGLSAGAAAGKIGPFTSSASADFSHTLSLVSILVYDIDGNLLEDVILDSESGYNYNPFLNRPFDNAGVPEPATMGLCAFALAGLIGLRARKRS